MQIGSARVDLADRRLMIVIEAESWEFHATPEAFRHDVRRYTMLSCRGWLVLRFLYEQVMGQPQVVKRDLEAAVAIRRRLLAA